MCDSPFLFGNPNWGIFLSEGWFVGWSFTWKNLLIFIKFHHQTKTTILQNGEFPLVTKAVEVSFGIADRIYAMERTVGDK